MPIHTAFSWLFALKLHYCSCYAYKLSPHNLMTSPAVKNLKLSNQDCIESSRTQTFIKQQASPSKVHRCGECGHDPNDSCAVSSIPPHVTFFMLQRDRQLAIPGVASVSKAAGRNKRNLEIHCRSRPVAHSVQTYLKHIISPQVMNL